MTLSHKIICPFCGSDEVTVARDMKGSRRCSGCHRTWLPAQDLSPKSDLDKMLEAKVEDLQRQADQVVTRKEREAFMEGGRQALMQLGGLTLPARETAMASLLAQLTERYPIKTNRPRVITAWFNDAPYEYRVVDGEVQSRPKNATFINNDGWSKIKFVELAQMGAIQELLANPNEEISE